MSDNPLEKLRKKLGYTEYKMAQLLDCSQTSYHALINAEKTSFKRLKLIADAFKLSDHDLRSLIYDWIPQKSVKPLQK